MYGDPDTGAVDFSAVALAKGSQLEASAAPAHPIEWICADVTAYSAAQHVDLALICYLQVNAGERKAALVNAATSLAPGGILLVVGHDSANRTDGTGGQLCQ